MSDEPSSEQLTHQDVARLLSDPSPTTRAEMAAKVAVNFDRQRLSPSERQLAEDIIRVMSRDAVVRVRQSLAENLKHSPNLPRDVALQMARDVEAVALPVLSVSKVLTDDDLIELVRTSSPSKQTAIAGRDEVSATVADALIDNAAEEAVAVLVANEKADLGESSLGRVIDRFGASAAVQTPLIHRSKLPLTVAERLVTLVSENLQQYLVTHHELPTTMATDLILDSRERATVSLFASDSEEADVDRLVTQLGRGGRLTPSLMLRALCTGDLAFFEYAISYLARIPVTNSRLLIHDAGRLGLKSVYDRASLPPSLYPAFRIAVDVARETDYDGGDRDRERHRRRMIERILTQYEDMSEEDLDYLLNKLNDMMRSAA
ncbi:MAG: DUF2336 domain-containing protein [Azospirillum sp.]|nr:DUF2336 domain-containing protein [Azospirillum sp.]